MMSWLGGNTALVSVVSGLSVLTMVASVVATPVVLARIPADYFAHDTRPKHPTRQGNGTGAWMFWLGRNTLGWLLVLLGVAMLALPGQGMLTILVGLMLADFPGKYRAQRWIVRRKKVRAGINWIRRKAGKEELAMESDPAATG